jgi:geranylgeranylglycerol-phosphate geranylgeranyltransferase
MSALRALRVFHPFPSAVNAVVVGCLFILARGAAADAVLLGIGMLGLQFCIGATNDVVDADLDAGRKPGKPIPAGWISRRLAIGLSASCGAIGLVIYARFGLVALAFGAAMLGIGLAYDLWLKGAGFGWACFAVAFPLLPLSTWWIAAGTLPPRPGLLLPLAAVAGPALSIANGLVDLERDASSGVPGIAVRLGRGRALGVLGLLLATIYGLAILSLVVDPAPAIALGAVIAAACLAAVGWLLSSGEEPAQRERGWQAQVVALALVTIGWVGVVAPR